MTEERLELEPGTDFRPESDRRPRMPEPPPVRLVAVADVVLPAPAGCEKKMDALYARLLGFEREEGDGGEGLVYLAENFRLIFEVREGLVERDGYRPLRIVVKSLPDAAFKLTEAEMAFEYVRGTEPGTECLALLDPAGNYLELVESREI